MDEYLEFLQQVPNHIWGIAIGITLMILGPLWLKKIDPGKPSKRTEDQRSQERFSQMIQTEEEDPSEATVEDDDGENRDK